MDQVDAVIKVLAEAAQRGTLTIWTIYDRPKDHPEGYIARRFEVSRGASAPTDHTLIADLDDLREIFAQAGLANISREEGDEPQIVESWI